MNRQIHIEGAREHNLRNVSLGVPKHRLVVFTGVSGSGKSSLVFDTIAAEAQRQLNETFSAFVRNRLPRYGRPDVDSIGNLSPVVIVDQRRIGGNARSTVGTITDLYAYIRLLFSRVGQPQIGESNLFSFNDPQGMCPRCSGLGRVVMPDVSTFLDLDKSLQDGAILLPGFGDGQYWYRQYADIGTFDATTPLRDWRPEEREALLYGGAAAAKLGRKPPKDYQGLLERFTRIYIQSDTELSDRKQAILDRFSRSAPCPECHGLRLNERALSVRVGGHSIADYASMEVSRLIDVVRDVRDTACAALVRDIAERLQALVDIGLGYLSLDRPTPSLSGGEGQRIKTVRHLGSSLVDMLYVFDEPTIGLHAHDVGRLLALLQKLRDSGNSVLVVEHDRDVILAADWVIDVGPGAGERGGQVVFEGSPRDLSAADTVTGRYLRAAMVRKRRFRPPTGSLAIEHATLHNLQDVSVRIPTGVLTAITGVAGSGKSTLINGVFLARHPEAVSIDQSALRGSRRSSPASYTGIMDRIRQLFAQATGVSPALFSANSAGACPGCKGLGEVYLDLAFMEGVVARCDVCEGRRFTAAVLQYGLRGRSIADVLDMPVDESLAFFRPEDEVGDVLQAMSDVGLGYLRLGQPLSTLSGGERQRIKLATVLHQKGAVYVLDEPTTGLHMADVATIIALLDRLVDAGNTVVVIEHNLDVIKNADWVIDMGPGGGTAGGRVLFEGTPEDLLSCPDSLTARHLRTDSGTDRG
jgi:excinuclease UvrABC ATPase subunit